LNDIPFFHAKRHVCLFHLLRWYEIVLCQLTMVRPGEHQIPNRDAFKNNIWFKDFVHGMVDINTITLSNQIV